MFFLYLLVQHVSGVDKQIGPAMPGRQEFPLGESLQTVSASRPNATKTDPMVGFFVVRPAFPRGPHSPRIFRQAQCPSSGRAPPSGKAPCHLMHGNTPSNPSARGVCFDMASIAFLPTHLSSRLNPDGGLRGRPSCFILQFICDTVMDECALWQV